MSATPPVPDPRRWYAWIAIAAFIAFGLWLRVHAVLDTAVIQPMRGDAVEYYAYAYNVKAYGVYSRIAPWERADQTGAPAPDAMRSPGYALFLMPLIEVPPTQSMLWRIGVWQSVFGALAIALAGWLAWRVFGPVCAVAVAALCAVSPHLVNSPIWILSEAIYAPVVVAMAVAWWFGVRSESSLRARTIAFAAVGIALGASLLLRPTLQYFLPVILVLTWFAAPTMRRRASVAILLGAALCVVPWVARNYATLGTSGDPHLAINALWHGSYPDFMYEGKPESEGMPYRFDPRAAIEQDNLREVMRGAWQRAQADPGTFLRWYGVGKAISLYAWNEVRIGDAFILSVSDSPYFGRPAFKFTHFVSRALHWPLVVLSAIGMVLAWRRRTRVDYGDTGAALIRMVAALMVYVTAVHVVGAPYPRYSVPFRPETYLLALFALHVAWRFVRDRRAASDAATNAAATRDAVASDAATRDTVANA